MSERDNNIASVQEFDNLMQEWTSLSVDCAQSLQRSGNLVNAAIMANETALVKVLERKENDNNLNFDENADIVRSRNGGTQRTVGPSSGVTTRNTPENGDSSARVRRGISISNTRMTISLRKYQGRDMMEDAPRQIYFGDAAQESSDEDYDPVKDLDRLPANEDSNLNKCFLGRRQTIADLYPTIRISTPNGTRRRTSSESSLESLPGETRPAREQLSLRFEPKRVGDPQTPTASVENFVGRLGEPNCVTPTLAPRSSQYTPGSRNGSNRKRRISIIAPTVAISPATPITKGPELAGIFRKMGADLPKRLVENEKALSARKNSLGGLNPPNVQESFDAGFIQAYKLIAQGIDQASHARHFVDGDYHDKYKETHSVKEIWPNGTRDTSSTRKVTVANNVLKGTFTQQIMDNVLMPLIGILNDPEADGVEENLNAIEAAMSRASRGTPVEVSKGRHYRTLERRTRPGLWELGRQLRRGASDAHQQMVGEVFHNETGVDVKELMGNIHELIGIYQIGVAKLQTLERDRKYR